MGSRQRPRQLDDNSSSDWEDITQSVSGEGRVPTQIHEDLSMSSYTQRRQSQPSRGSVVSMAGSCSRGHPGSLPDIPRGLDTGIIGCSMGSAGPRHDVPRSHVGFGDDSVSMSSQSPASTRPEPQAHVPPPTDIVIEPPPTLTPQQLNHRLHILLDEVLTVIRSYSTTMNPSPRRIQSLHSFYDQIYDLLHPPSPDLFAMDVDVPGTSVERRGLTMEVVERLEKEWWESEVVAAWYGPAPAVAARRSSLPRRPSIALEPMTGQQSPRGDATGEVGKNANQRDRGETIKRDASYVGLYDE